MFKPTEYQAKALELLLSAERALKFIKTRKNSPYYAIFSSPEVYIEDVAKWEYIVSRLKKWYAKIYLQQVKEMVEYLGVAAEDYELSHELAFLNCPLRFTNKYLIIKK